MKKVAIALGSLVLLLPLTAVAVPQLCLIPRTGQNLCYDPTGATPNTVVCGTTGQDGELQAGIPWPSPRFTNNNDGTITDNLTGLMWTQDADPTTGKVDWDSALAYATSLNSGTAFGYADWRLPNKNELASLLNQGTSGTQAAWLISQGFVNVQTYRYWTSTTEPSATSNAVTISFDNGKGSYFSKSDAATVYGRWAVRNATYGYITLPKTGQTTCYDAVGVTKLCGGTGQDGDLQAGGEWPGTRFTDNGNSTMTDGLTQLIWPMDAKTPDPGPCGGGVAKTFAQALTYVACLNSQSYLGKTDWRVPNLNELASLRDAERLSQSAWLTAQGFSNVQAGWYLVSTSASITFDALDPALNPQYGFVVKVASGEVDYLLKGGSQWVWPVRGPEVATAGLSAPANFGSVAVGSTSNAQSITLSNTGTGPLVITMPIATTGGASSMFTVTAGTCGSLTPTLAGGASCALSVTFTPSASGAQSTTLRVISNDAGSPTDVTLNGTGGVTQSIPTASEWGMIVLFFGLAGVMAKAMSDRRQTA